MPRDTEDRFVIDAAGNSIAPPRGASDAFLMPYHVERGKIMVRARLRSVPYIDEEQSRGASSLPVFRCPTMTTTLTPIPKLGWCGRPISSAQLGDPLIHEK